ncbi:hypothetical protein SmJEL517_g00773 [Synchytrium microbalum]|uniref:Histone-binding protein RBBP4 N-terminal domain-containing protein n=1 Tax=Synchytrium microbalum TaxID=1806994 RepID=A0A507C7U3_9FUNG|nr:uncharacterized protein SmJEL517_g00773 [Synchytrium microbalum]TPX37650.1 hypothetical protein SmJEL517_g00773 [Synchytrium microbalum]
MATQPHPPPPIPTSSYREIYTYNAPWPVYAQNWSQRPNTFRLALGSYIEEYRNKASNLDLGMLGGSTPDVLGTTGDYLRIWELPSSDILETNASNHIGEWARPVPNLTLRSTLANVRRIGQSKRDFCAPLTSFDWNETDQNLIVTSSIDTTCTVWDVHTQQAKTQLIAHDKEVYDVAFARGADVFASVGADGSVRMFDLRSLDHSTIIYETPAPSSNPSSSSNNNFNNNMSPSPSMATANPTTTSITLPPVENPPLLRLSWNKQDPNYIATFQMESDTVLILDVRVPAVPVVELHAHASTVNTICWAPHASGLICTAGDDSQALVWDVSKSKQRVLRDPLLAYTADAEINQLAWNTAQPDFVSISFGSTIQALKI